MQAQAAWTTTTKKSCVYYILWLHCSRRTHDGKRSRRSLHPVPCYLRQLHHTIPLINWSSFIIKPVRLLLATHSSCWKAVPELPSSAGCKTLSSFQREFIKQNPFQLAFWMHNFNPDGGGSTGWRDFSAFLLLQKSGKTFLRCRKPTARMNGRDQIFTHTFLLFGHGVQVMSLQLLSFLPFYFSIFFKDYFLPGRAFYPWWNTLGQLTARRKHLYKLCVQNLRWATRNLQAVHSEGVHRITRPSLNIIKCWELHSKQQDGLILPSGPWMCYDSWTWRIT